VHPVGIAASPPPSETGSVPLPPVAFEVPPLPFGTPPVVSTVPPPLLGVPPLENPVASGAFWRPPLPVDASLRAGAPPVPVSRSGGFMHDPPTHERPALQSAVVEHAARQIPAEADDPLHAEANAALADSAQAAPAQPVSPVHSAVHTPQRQRSFASQFASVIHDASQFVSPPAV
jgi:hypothetical protein